jgi:hypothetical protein
MTYDDVSMACAREGIVRGPDARARQVGVDLTHSVMFLTLWTLTGLDRMPRIGESGHFVLRVQSDFNRASHRVLTVEIRWLGFEPWTHGCHQDDQTLG